jgi:hypothetical protein
MSGINGQSQIYNNFAVATFIKQNDIVNITTNYTRIENDVVLSSTNACGHVCFIFNIVGLDKYRVKDVLNNRLLK